MALKNVTGPSLEVKYPTCRGTPSAVVPVRATFSGGYEELSSALRIPFGATMWLALTVHAVGVEYYVSSTSSQNAGSKVVC